VSVASRIGINTIYSLRLVFDEEKEIRILDSVYSTTLPLNCARKDYDDKACERERERVAL